MDDILHRWFLGYTDAASPCCRGSKRGNLPSQGRWRLQSGNHPFFRDQVKELLLTAFLPVENIHDDGDVVAAEVDVDLRTSVLASCCRD